MRASQFFALNKQILTLLKEEEARSLTIYHAGEPAKRLSQLVSELNARQKIVHVRDRAENMIARGEARAAAASELDAARERQRILFEEARKDPQAWVRKMRDQIAAEQAQQAMPPSD